MMHAQHMLLSNKTFQEMLKKRPSPFLQRLRAVQIRHPTATGASMDILVA